uniref:Uncharacterized protein n=1 Tax=Heterorhabditis bacteriophora TaxID=37862 RepID=A0A1I7WK20_HETBA
MTKKPLLDEEEEENVSKDNEIINIVDKEAIEALTNTLFLRISNERQSQFTKNPISSKEKNKVLESALLGNIQEDDFKDALWRIMGMRMRFEPLSFLNFSISTS